MLKTQWAQFLAFLAVDGGFSNSISDYFWCAYEAIGAEPDVKDIFWRNHLLYPKDQWDVALEIMSFIWPMPGKE